MHDARFFDGRRLRGMSCDGAYISWTETRFDVSDHLVYGYGRRHGIWNPRTSPTVRSEREVAGVSRRIAPAIVLDEAPTFAARHFTEKRSLNARLICERRRAVIDALHFSTASGSFAKGRKRSVERSALCILVARATVSAYGICGGRKRRARENVPVSGKPKREGGVVIAGAGQAGCQLAASLRELGYAGRVTLIGDEPHLPYQRPPLSKAFLNGTVDVGALSVRPDTFFDQNQITLARGCRATAIDRSAREVATESGERISYDHLVLATGARNRSLDLPGAELEGVLQLRSLDDAIGIRRALQTAKKIVIVGAGFIGLELAALAAGRNHRVDVVETSERPMMRAVSEQISSFLKNAHEASGVSFHFQESIRRLHGRDGKVVGAETSSGKLIEGDLVLIGVGVVPNVELALVAGLAVENGIKVDERLLTQDGAISSIGDCTANPQHFADGVFMRLESVQNAVDQARCVAARLTGIDQPYTALPWFWSEQGRWKLQIAGLSIGHDQSVLRGDPHSGGFSVFCYRLGRLVAVESVNKPADHIIARRLIVQSVAVPANLAADVGVDLKSLATSGRAVA